MGRSGRSCEESMRMRRSHSHFPVAVALVPGAAAAAAHIEASSAVGRVEACGMIAQAAGSRSPVPREDEPGRTAAEGSCRAGCGVRRGCRDRWRDRDRCRAGRAWSVNRSWCRTPVLYSRVNPRTTKFRCYWGRRRGQLAELINVFLERTWVVRRC